MNYKHYFIITILSFLLVQSCTDPLGTDPIDTKEVVELTNINDATTLTNHRDGVDYIAKSGIQIRNALTIEAGVEIQFESGSYLSVYSNGTITANGTASEMIIMTNTGNNFADWAGIEINSTNSSNILNYCLIEYAGDGELFGLYNTEYAAVTLNGGRVRMDNCIIQKSGGSGFVTASTLNECIISSFENNRFIENKSYPVFIHQDYVIDMNLNSCIFSDNSKNMIGINSEHGDRLYKKSVWKKQDIPYFVIEGFDIIEGLTIEAGTEIIFGNNAFLEVAGYVSSSFLTIQGTQSNHVVLRGEEALIGYWKGIRVESTNAKNILEYTDISDGGGQPDSPANITLFNGGTNLTINNCTSARSGNCDVILDDFLGAPVLTNNSPEITEVCEQ